jgi:hypothetical protein
VDRCERRVWPCEDATLSDARSRTERGLAALIRSQGVEVKRLPITKEQRKRVVDRARLAERQRIIRIIWSLSSPRDPKTHEIVHAINSTSTDLHTKGQEKR